MRVALKEYTEDMLASHPQAKPFLPVCYLTETRETRSPMINKS